MTKHNLFGLLLLHEKILGLKKNEVKKYNQTILLLTLNVLEYFFIMTPSYGWCDIAIGREDAKQTNEIFSDNK